MTKFVVTVEFRLKPGTMKPFRALMDRNAIDSCRHEPGCHRFDVLVPHDTPDSIFLYEIYEDRTAFDAHTKTVHFDTFDRGSADYVISKAVQFHALECEGSTAGEV